MKIGFIGCGNMGGALARAAAKTNPECLYLADYSKEKAEALARELSACAKTNKEISAKADLVFLAVKPNVIASVVEDIKGELLDSGATVVTMAAGVKIEKLEAILGKNHPIIRIMPNTPAAVGKGMITWCKNSAVSKERESDLLLSLSEAGTLDLISESMIDAASALAGCGPAFVYMFADALADGAVACGLPRDKALSYAVETLIGAAEMIKTSGKHPEKLKDEVCSPGGSTIEGVLALENGAFRSTSSAAVISAFEKTKLLGK